MRHRLRATPNSRARRNSNTCSICVKVFGKRVTNSINKSESGRRGNTPPICPELKVAGELDRLPNYLGCLSGHFPRRFGLGPRRWREYFNLGELGRWHKHHHHPDRAVEVPRNRTEMYRQGVSQPQPAERVDPASKNAVASTMRTKFGRLGDVC